MEKRSLLFNLLIAACSGLTLWTASCLSLQSSLVVCPTDVAISLRTLLLSSELYTHMFASILRVLEGYVLSVLLALPIAFLCSKSRNLRERLLPLHDFIRYIPVPAFVPLCAVIFGVGDLTKVSLIFIGTYFQVVFMFIADIAAVPRQIEESARCLGLHGPKLWSKVIFRASLPGMLESARIAFAWAWSYLLVAEVVNARRGIGYLVLQAYRVLAMDRMLAIIVIIGLYGMASDYIFRKFNAWLCPWVQGGIRAAGG